MGIKLAGIMLSQACDSESDSFTVSGVSIEHLRGAIVNSEHEKSWSKTIGKIIDVRKIYTEDDCKSDQEKGFLKKNNSMPFIYGCVELMNETGHTEALAVSQIVEFHKTADGKYDELPLFYSIEIEPVSVSSNKVYSLSVAKRVGIVRNPANRACILEV